MSWLHRCLAASIASGFAVVPSFADENPKPVSYYKEIRPILQQHCLGCHQPAKAGGSYVMTLHAEMFKAGNTGKEPIIKGSPDKSLLVQQLLPQGAKPPAMPKEKEPLPE